MSARPFLIKQRSSWLLLPLALHLSLALVDEHAKLTIEHPLPGVWRATTEVSLAVALGEEAKARMDELSGMLLWGCRQSHMCRTEQDRRASAGDHCLRTLGCIRLRLGGEGLDTAH